MSIKISLPKGARVGMMLSGGLDSGVLLCYLLKALGPRLKVYTVDRPDKAPDHSRRMLKAVSEEFGVEGMSIELVGNGTVDHRQQVYTGIREVLDNNLVDCLMIADTALPSDSELKNHDWAPFRGKDKDFRVIQPFIEVGKNEVIELAHKDELDFVFEQSHSCTERPEGRCGECWQCLERAWAFRQCGLDDPGKM